jgi:hypothetical protein
LRANCVRCHGAEEKIKGKLKLTSRESMMKGGRSGPAIVPEHPEKSLLIQAINYDKPQMPPRGKLPKAEIDALTKWVKMGAPWPADVTSIAAKASGPPVVDDQARQFWAFQPLQKIEPPSVKQKSWVRNPIDAFVLAKLEAAGMKPAPPAEKTSLLRRVHFAVTGLPPTPAEVDAFLADESPDAYDKVVDKLLASRHYGEHWGRHWLDLVRYAESCSFERDSAKPFAWRYRDYVIRSFNADKPYDRFVREQLAGDELDDVSSDSIIATGFYRLGPSDDDPSDALRAYYDDMDDVIGTMGQVFLGLTTNCARCHDHKIDPFPQKDYYKLVAFLHGIRRYSADSVRPIGTKEEILRSKDVLAKRDATLAELQKKMSAIEEAVQNHLQGGERDDFKHEPDRASLIKKYVPSAITQQEFNSYMALRKERDELKKSPPAAAATALCVTEDGPNAKDTFVLLRGNPQSQGDKVEPGFPSVLIAPDALPRVMPNPGKDAKSSGRRRVLADWLADARNPLPTRVIVNRIWQYNFGRGLVRSSNNFGYQGTPPTHPELLEWLANEFIAGGQKFKPIHRLILTSNAFRMSSQAEPAVVAKDPENDLLGRFDLRRLTAEEVRDSILAASGNLNLAKKDGPSVYPVIPAEVLAGQSRPGDGWGKSTPEEAASRSVFVYIKRAVPVPLLAAFDGPDLDATCPVRFTTTQPTQALALINSDFLNSQAKTLAESIKKDSGADVKAQVRLALRRVLQRGPTDKEVDRGLRFIEQAVKADKLTEEEALRRFCVIALNLNEFVYLD